jgi:hypothetical protein
MQTLALEPDSLAKVNLRMISAFERKAEYAQVRTKVHVEEGR